MSQKLVVTSNIAQFSKNMAIQKMHFLEAFPQLAKDAAISTCKNHLEHSFPAPGNDPSKGGGNTTAAYQQGKDNLAKEIRSMFIPLNSISVATLVAQRNELLWNLDNPIQWRDEGLAKAWANRNMDAMWDAFMSTDQGLGDYAYDEGSLYKAQDFSKTEYAEKPTVVLQRQMRNPDGRWDGRSKVAVKNRQVIEQFIKERTKSIGKSANGWKECLKALGSSVMSVLPGRGVGTVSTNGSKGDVVIRCKNAHGDFAGMVSRSGVLEKIKAEESAKFAKACREKIAQIIKAHTMPKDPKFYDMGSYLS
jgi:hypothetical protein